MPKSTSANIIITTTTNGVLPKPNAGCFVSIYKKIAPTIINTQHAAIKFIRVQFIRKVYHGLFFYSGGTRNPWASSCTSAATATNPWADSKRPVARAASTSRQKDS